MMDTKLTILEAFNVMKMFLEGYYKSTHSDDIGSLLGDLQFFGNTLKTADPAAWEDWLECVNEILKKRTN